MPSELLFGRHVVRKMEQAKIATKPRAAMNALLTKTAAKLVTVCSTASSAAVSFLGTLLRLSSAPLNPPKQTLRLSTVCTPVTGTHIVTKESRASTPLFAVKTVNTR